MRWLAAEAAAVARQKAQSRSREPAQDASQDRENNQSFVQFVPWPLSSITRGHIIPHTICKLLLDKSKHGHAMVFGHADKLACVGLKLDIRQVKRTKDSFITLLGL